MSRLTKDDVKTIRIHLQAIKEELCNQRRWNEAREYEELIEKLQTIPQWIPCSERLPELKEWVLVSSGDCVVSDCLVVRGGNQIWHECGRIDIENDAWMPLPEPYRTEGRQ